MARMRAEPPKTPDTARTGVVVPVELACGACLEVWGDPAGEAEAEWGPMGALLAAWGRFSRARTAWEKAEALDTATSCRLLPGGAPWSVTGPGGPDRLARLGLTTTDLPTLRAAAQERVAASDPATRRRV